MVAPPVLDLDPFGDDFLSDPDPFHEQLREAGPVVRLRRYGVWAMARFAEVHTALRDHETYCSSAGVGLSDFRKEKPWRPPSLLLEADPPEHARARRVTARAVSPRVLERLRPDFEKDAARIVGDVVARGGVDGGVDGGVIDGVTDLALAYPLRVFPDAVGLDRDGRENLLVYGDMLFNVFGPRNRLFADSTSAAEPVRAWIAEHCRRGSLRPGGLGSEIYAAVDAGEVTEDEGGLLVRSLLSAGVDTTVHALSWALHALATQPDQWAALREDPSLARAAFEETLRHASPVQTFFRTTTREVDVAGTTVPEGEKVLLFLGAANRDPREWQDPHRFDIRRRAVGHVGFGSGIHACVGAAIARLEAEVLLTELARQVRTLELAGPVRLHLNNVLRGLASLPLRVRAA
jgi:4-methoxybenzoate monooxygenase (O-demethylating)